MESASKKSESLNSGIWDKLKFENLGKRIVDLSHLGWIKGNRKSHKRGNMTYKGKKIVSKGRKDGRKEGKVLQHQTKSKDRMSSRISNNKSTTATEPRFSRTSTATSANKLVEFLNLNFQESLKKMQKCIYYIQITG